MNNDWIIISKEGHADARWHPRYDYGFAQHEQWAPVALAELPQVLPHYVIGFLADQTSAVPVVLLGCGDGKNLYLDQHCRWSCPYVPAYFRAYPFTLLPDQQGNQVLAIHRDHLGRGEQSAPLLSPTGELADQLKQIAEFLVSREGARKHTASATQLIMAHKLLEDWPLVLDMGPNKDSIAIRGLKRINQSALNALPASDLAELRDAGALLLAYAQLFAMSQVDSLAERHRKGAVKSQESGSVPALDAIFPEVEALSFDFLKK